MRQITPLCNWNVPGLALLTRMTGQHSYFSALKPVFSARRDLLAPLVRQKYAHFHPRKLSAVLKPSADFSTRTLWLTFSYLKSGYFSL